MISELLALWSELDVAAVAPGITVRRFHASAPVDIFVGIENPVRTRLVLIEAASSAVSAYGTDRPQSAGFTVNVERGEYGHRARVVVRLALPAYRDVFSALVADLLGSLQSATNEASAVASFMTRLERWQRLLARHGPDGLSVTEQRGLYGELLFIRDILLPATTPAGVVDAWTGPLAKDQDFQLARCSVEVKVSAGNPDHEVHVSNVRQLDESASPSGALFLFHASVEERHNQGESLVALVETLRRALGPLVERFNDLLVHAGYLDVHGQRYAHTGYVVKGRRFFAVREGFPRILERELRPGVGDVRYTVQLGTCAPFAVASELVLAIIRGGSDA
jgi:hypothetical protein